MIRDTLQPQADDAWTDEKLREVCLEIARGINPRWPNSWTAKYLGGKIAELLAEARVPQEDGSPSCVLWADEATRLTAERDAAVKRAADWERRFADARRQLAESERASGAETRRADDLQRQLAEAKAVVAKLKGMDEALSDHARLHREAEAHAEAAEAACAAMRSQRDEHSANVDTLVAENRRLRETLEFFADRRHWSSSDPKWLVGPSAGYTIAQTALRLEGEA